MRKGVTMHPDACYRRRKTICLYGFMLLWFYGFFFMVAAPRNMQECIRYRPHQTSSIGSYEDMPSYTSELGTYYDKKEFCCSLGVNASCAGSSFVQLGFIALIYVPPLLPVVHLLWINIASDRYHFNGFYFLCRQY